jgi:hypothetical protein
MNEVIYSPASRKLLHSDLDRKSFFHPPEGLLRGTLRTGPFSNVRILLQNVAQTSIEL